GVERYVAAERGTTEPGTHRLRQGRTGWVYSDATCLTRPRVSGTAQLEILSGRTESTDSDRPGESRLVAGPSKRRSSNWQDRSGSRRPRILYYSGRTITKGLGSLDYG